MVKVSLVVYIAIGVGLLLFLSLSPKHAHDDHHPHPSRRHGHRRLKVKSNFTFTAQDHLEHHDPHHDFRRHHHHDSVAFDPMVAEMERHQEDKEWERMYFDEHHKEFAEIARHHDHDHQEEDAHHHHLDDHHEHHQQQHHEHHQQQHHEHHQQQHHEQHHQQQHHEHHLQHHHEHHQQHHEPEWEEFNHPDDFLNDEDKFNMTNRLVLLFPQIDLDPSDGFVSEKELTKWNLDQAMREVLHRSQREMELHDKNHDGFVSLFEYDPPAWVKSSDNKTFGYDMGWWKEEHFNASDMNGDGLLNLTEFNDFLHPANTKNPKLLQWLCKEEIRVSLMHPAEFGFTEVLMRAIFASQVEIQQHSFSSVEIDKNNVFNGDGDRNMSWERDTDKDGKINFNEFFHGLFDLVRNYEEEGHNTTHHTDTSMDSHAARKLFNQLDKDSDGLLTDTELLPIIGKLHPSEHYYAKQQADYIISQADIDKDGRLSLAEMLENPYVFYSSAVGDEDEDDYDYHDELR